MRIKAYDLIELTNILASHFPPPGWKVEVGIRPKGEEWEVEVSSPMTPNSWTEWEDDWFVFSLKNELHNVPGFPEEWGDDWDEALWNLLHDAVIPEELLPALEHWKEDQLWDVKYEVNR